MDPSPEESPSFGRFRALECLGSGGMGVVYRAVDPETDREVALKALRVAAAEDIYRLKREFRALVSLVHPNLIELYELFFLEQHKCFFTMELVRGWPCTEWVRHTRLAADDRPPAGVDAARILVVLRQLHDCLTAVHAAGHVHRDIKPSNVMISSTGRLVLLDFGLVAALGTHEWFESGRAMIAGTVPYMAPEQLRGDKPSTAMDWYAVGVMLYEMLTGEVPFTGPLHEVVVQKEWRRISLHKVGGEFVDLVSTLLDPDPQRRAGAADVEDALLRLGEAKHAVAPPARPEPFCGRRREMERLRGMLDRVRPERPVVVRINGSSGMGKTRLLTQFVDELREDALVFRGRCHPNETLPYKGLDRIVDEISRYLIHLPDTTANALVPRHVAALLRLFPVLGRVQAFADHCAPLGALEPQEIRRRGFAALRDLLGKVADRDKVIVWIDDVQWGDIDSARLVAELLRPPDAPGVLLLLSYPFGDAAAEALLEHLLGTSGTLAAQRVEELSIGPLTEGEACELAGVLLAGAGEPTGEVAAQIASESEGSPLLVSELVGHFRIGRAPLGPEVPRGKRLERLTFDRIEALTAEARDLLELVAIAGGPLERSVLASAAGGSVAPRALLSILGQRWLVRDTSVEQRPAVEAFHERIREAIVAHMPAERQVACHRRLGRALQRTGAAAPEALARHLHAAGDDVQAAEYAVAAGDAAAKALAFLRAAEHYATALLWRGSDANWARTVRQRRADALVNAGRSADAATEYLAAAPSAPLLENLDLRRLACKQFLAAGRVEEALAVLRPLLAQIGLRYPTSAPEAGVRIALRVGALSLRAPRLGRERPAGRSSTDLFRVDVCDAVARGLIPVDPIRGVHFLLLGLTLAQRAGEPGRYGRFLTGVGGSVLAMGPRPLRRRGRQMIEVADRIAVQLADHYIQGSASAARGQVALARGAWREALHLSDTAAELDQGYLGVTFERNVARMASLRALEELGNIAEIARRADDLCRRASSQGDRYGEVTARLNLAYVRLAQDAPDEAAAMAEGVLSQWPRQGFYIQHFYAHRVAIHAALYRGAVDDAWQRTMGIWKALVRSGLLFVPLPHFDAHLLRARVSLAVAACQPSRAHTLLRGCEREVRHLERAPRADGRAHATLLRAACRALAGDVQQACRLLGEAEEAFGVQEMALHAACARYRREQLLGVAVADDTTWLSRHGIRRGTGWLRIFAPGFPADAAAPPAGALTGNGPSPEPAAPPACPSGTAGSWE